MVSRLLIPFRWTREKSHKHRVLDLCLSCSHNSAFLHTTLCLVRRVPLETSGEGHLHDARDASVCIITAHAQWKCDEAFLWQRGLTPTNIVLPSLCVLKVTTIVHCVHALALLAEELGRRSLLPWHHRTVARSCRLCAKLRSYCSGNWGRITRPLFAKHGPFSLHAACSALVSDKVSFPELIRNYQLDWVGWCRQNVIPCCCTAASPSATYWKWLHSGPMQACSA